MKQLLSEVQLLYIFASIYIILISTVPFNQGLLCTINMQNQKWDTELLITGAIWTLDKEGGGGGVFFADTSVQQRWLDKSCFI